MPKDLKYIGCFCSFPLVEMDMNRSIYDVISSVAVAAIGLEQDLMLLNCRMSTEDLLLFLK